jgi:hypothetical protein
MSTAVVPAAPVHSVTLPSGAVITSNMTPVERHNAIAKSMGAPTVERQTQNLFPVTGMTDGTAAELARRDAQAGKAPPSAAPAKPAVPTPAEKVAALDAELQARGIQKIPQAPRALDGKFVAKATVGDIDAGFIAALTNAYRALSPADREAKRAQFEAELAEGYAGRKLGETRGNFLFRTAGQPGSDAPVVQPHVPGHEPEEAVSMDAALGKATAASNKYGFAPASAITGALLHGYKIPAGEWHVAELVAGLRLARAGNLSQSQVDAIIAKSGA